MPRKKQKPRTRVGREIIHGLREAMAVERCELPGVTPIVVASENFEPLLIEGVQQALKLSRGERRPAGECRLTPRRGEIGQRSG